MHSIHHVAVEPASNELPVALASPDVKWRGDGIMFAVPSLLVYTTGAELLVLCRTSAEQDRTIEQAETVSDTLPVAMRANGHPVILLGGEHLANGFTYRAWVPFRPDEAGQDLVLTLDWPGVTAAEHRIAADAVRAAISGVAVLS